MSLWYAYLMNLKFKKDLRFSNIKFEETDFLYKGLSVIAVNISIYIGV